MCWFLHRRKFMKSKWVRAWYFINGIQRGYRNWTWWITQLIDRDYSAAGSMRWWKSEGNWNSNENLIESRLNEIKSLAFAARVQFKHSMGGEREACRFPTRKQH